MRVLTIVIFEVLLFFYIFPISFVFSPLSTNVLIGVLGGITIFVLGAKKLFVLLAKIKNIVFWLILISISSLLTLAINGHVEMLFLYYFKGFIINFLAVCFFVFFFRRLKLGFDFLSICKYMVIANVVQLCIAVTMFYSPSVNDFLFSIQKESSYSLKTIEKSFDMRLLGFGSMFFYAGIINSITLICNSFLYINSKSLKEKLLISNIHIFIFFIGILMSRTTYLGLILSFIIILSKRHQIHNFSLLFITNICVFLFLIMFFISYEDLQGFYEYGLELLYNYQRGDGFESRSTNDLLTMYRLPDNFKTWILGDGYWSNPLSENGYYMNTDVGYLRLIYHFGILGLFIFLKFFISQICFIIKRNNDMRLFCIVVSLLYLVSLLKGFSDITNVLLLFQVPLMLKLHDAPNNNCYVNRNQYV